MRIGPSELLREPVEYASTLCKNKSEYAVVSPETDRVTCKTCRTMLNRAQFLRATKFTMADKAFIHTCAQSVWDYIGFDVLASTAQMKGTSTESVTVTRADVMEMVIDADRLDNQLREESRTWAPEERSRFFAIWDTLTYTARRQLVRPAFPHGRYGL
jgi:hypothetical protein